MRSRLYDLEKAKSLIAAIGTSGTANHTDVFDITKDPEFQGKLIAQEAHTSGSSIVVRSYRYHQKDLSDGNPINQYVDLIQTSGLGATITRQPKDQREHWSNRLPARVCSMFGCGSCLYYMLDCGGVNISPCLNKFVSGTVVSLGDRDAKKKISHEKTNITTDQNRNTKNNV